MSFTKVAEYIFTVEIFSFLTPLGRKGWRN